MPTSLVINFLAMFTWEFRGEADDEITHILRTGLIWEN